MLSAGKFDELGRDVDVIRGVVDGLASASAYIVLVPTVAIKLMLLACVSES